MVDVILDTNFMMNCLQSKVDFVEKLKEIGFEILVPTEVIEELERIVKSKKKLRFREDATLVLKIIESESLKKISLGIRGRHYVDKGIVKYLKENPKAFLASMDKELKKKVSNSKIVLRARKKLEIV